MYFQIFAMHFESFSNEFIDFFQNQLNQWIQIQIELSTSRNADSTNGSWRLQSSANRPHKAPFHIDKNNLKSGCQRIKRRNLSTVVGKNTTLTIIMNEVKKNQAARKFTGENVKSCCCESTRIFGKIMKMPKFIQISIKRLKNFIFSSVALWFWLLLQELLEIKVKSGRKQNVQFPVEELSQAHPERERSRSFGRTQNFLSFHLLAFIFLFHYRRKSFSFLMSRSGVLCALRWWFSFFCYCLSPSSNLQRSTMCNGISMFNFNNDRCLPWRIQKCNEGLSSLWNISR